MTTYRERIENNERIPREAFRNAERKGEFAPHVFVENPTNAVCQECDLVIDFEVFLDPAVKRALETDANDASLEELETAERILDDWNHHVTVCADCGVDITMVNTHECKEQRAANRRAQARARRCPKCGGKLKPAETKCPHGNCEYGWPAANSEGRIE